MRHYSLFFLLVLFIPMAQGQNDDIQSANGLPVGQEAPLFSAPNQQNQHFSLAEALEQGPVLLVFYRGQWCPFCNRHLSQIQDSLALLKARGLQVIAISPEKPELLRESA